MQGQAQTPFHPTDSTALVLKAVQSVSEQHCCCLCCPQDKQMVESCSPSTGASCTMGAMEQLLPDIKGTEQEEALSQPILTGEEQIQESRKQEDNAPSKLPQDQQAFCTGETWPNFPERCMPTCSK
ncbi:uncharacterized protein ACIB01_005445 isoform 1-T1 [Guaruba guarouba]